MLHKLRRFPNTGLLTGLRPAHCSQNWGKGRSWSQSKIREMSNFGPAGTANNKSTFIAKSGRQACLAVFFQPSPPQSIERTIFPMVIWWEDKHICEQLQAKLQQNYSSLCFVQLRYNKKGIASLFLIPGTQLPKTMEFPVSCLLYANEVAPGRREWIPSGCGPVARKVNHSD